MIWAALGLVIVAVNLAGMIPDLEDFPRHGFDSDHDTVLILEGLQETGGNPNPRWLYGSWVYAHVHYYRPVTSYLYWAEWRLFGENRWFYSYVGMGLHILLSLWLFSLVWLLSRSPAAGFFSALAFSDIIRQKAGAGLSPTYMWWPAQHDPLYGLFYVISLFFLVRYLREARLRHMILSLSFFALAIGCKESAYSLPLLVPVILWYERSPDKLRRALPFFGLAIVAFTFRWFALGPAGMVSTVRADHSILSRLLQQIASPVLGPLLTHAPWPTITGVLLLGLIIGICQFPALRTRILYLVIPLMAAAIVGAAQLCYGHWAVASLPYQWGRVNTFLIFACGVLALGLSQPRNLVLAVAWMVITYLPSAPFVGMHYGYFGLTGLAMLDGMIGAIVLRTLQDFGGRALKWARTAKDRAHALSYPGEN